ncbi:hypothetical protein B0A55_03649 [Friedmanniomyces simplex]|uniref:Ferric reductase NAD binding domain-containing protein n=1 Tax=Friedmanniomyces simplex TaxID=329884 RepID=A0A4U0XKI7_9PEZI|nr:hypothetical protein B0A55_03649 [Friedmanniomyces simplex]
MATIRSSIPHEDRTATEPLKFLPGQWLDTFIPGLRKAGGFTITSTPAEARPSSHSPPYVELAIQKSSNPPAQWLWRPQEEIIGSQRVVRVGGSFVWPPPRLDVTKIDRLVLVAGGVGINPLISIFSHLIRSVTSPREIHFIYMSRVAPSSGDIDPQSILFLPRLMDLVAAIADPINVTLSLFLTGAAAEGAATDDRGIIEHGKLPNRTFGHRVTEADLVRAIDGYKAPVYGPEHDRQGTVCYVCGPPRMTDEFHIYRLSSIDRGLVRTYIWYCLWFPCDANNIDTAVSNFHNAIEKLIAHLPILAGSIRSLPDTDSEPMIAQPGRLEVYVGLQEVSNFRATVRYIDYDEFWYTYPSLAQSRLPPAHLISPVLTPLPDAPENDALSSPVFAAQANIIKDGLLVALYLHHSVADVHGLSQIIRLMSSNSAPRAMNDETLRTDAATQSKLRARLSGVWAAKPDQDTHTEYTQHKQPQETSQLIGREVGTCRVLAFDLATIEKTKEMMNERFHDIYEEKIIHISAFDCLAAILWKAISRASWPQGPPGDDSGRFLKLTIPVSIRTRLPNTSLPDGYFGNALVHAETHSRVLELNKPFELTALAHEARQVRMAVRRITELVIQSKIATVNSLEDVPKAGISNRSFDTNLVITSWADLSTEGDAGLGLGLGAPERGRKIGRANTGYGCIVLPVRREEGLWEVQVTFTEELMARMLADEGLMKFVSWVA